VVRRLCNQVNSGTIRRALTMMNTLSERPNNPSPDSPDRWTDGALLYRYYSEVLFKKVTQIIPKKKLWANIWFFFILPSPFDPDFVYKAIRNALKILSGTKSGFI